MNHGEAFWKYGILYQIYPRSFADSNSDGIGDLRGIADHLDYLQWLGVDGIWLCPVTASPNADWGYDVADYCDVDPDLGSLDELDDLINKATACGLRIVLDLVPNHTSDQHSWFKEARLSQLSPKRAWYVWADPKPDGSLPNNWVSSFGGPAWTLDEPSNQYYLNNFLPAQPDLNWWSEEVRNAFDQILRFWFDRGVAGFRIDVCNMIVKDIELRDNPPATPDDDWMTQVFGQRSVYNSNRPEVHEVLRHWRQLADHYDTPRLLLGETNVEDLDTLISFYGDGTDELHLAFNFPFINAAFDSDSMRKVVEDTEARLPSEAWPVWTGSNHDVSRFPSRWAQGDDRKSRLAALILLTLRGTPVLYQGDELGLTDTDIEQEDLRDPVGIRFWPLYAGRDPVRTPMPWDDGPGAGFTDPGIRPWLPFGDVAARNVETQKSDPNSMLCLVRDLIRIRRASADLAGGDYASLACPDGVWAWKRGTSSVVACNLSEEKAIVELGSPGHVVMGTGAARQGESFSHSVVVGPWEGLVVQLSRGASPSPR